MIKKVLYFLTTIIAFFLLSYGFVRLFWQFSQDDPILYTVLISVIFAILILFYIIRKFLSELKKLPTQKEKNHFIKKTLYVLLRIILVLAGILLMIRTVFDGRIVTGLVILIISLAAAWAVRFLP